MIEPVTDLGHRITTNNVFRAVFDRDIESMHLHVGPLDVTGRGVYFFYVAATLLIVAGIVALVTRSSEVTTKWKTWTIIALVVGIPLWIGKETTLPLVIVIASIAVWEYGRMFALPYAERGILHALAVLYPVAAYWRPELLHLAPFFALMCAVPTIVAGDLGSGLRRATLAAFGSIWICWSLSMFIVIWKDAFLVCFAVAVTDVSAWCGGKALKRFGWAAKSLSPLSPNKTVGGLAGGLIGAALALCLMGSISVGLVLAVGLGATLGDLLESLLKREVGVKDAGDWLPGFGGLLDRIDSILLVLPLAAVIGGFG